MHEYSIVASLIDRVQQEAAAYDGARVHRLHVKIGELSGVELELQLGFVVGLEIDLGQDER